MHRYHAFGLTIASHVLLNELNPEEDEHRSVDITIRRQDIGHNIPPLGNPFHFDFEDPEGILMIWPGAAGVLIKSANEVYITPYEDVPETYLAFPILGPVLGWMLHMRGLMVLHASSVSLDGRSFSFMGDKMAGKSTTAAAFIRAGGLLLTDDLLAIDFEAEDKPIILPSFPQLKLADDSASEVQVPGATALPLVMEGFEKRQHRLADMHDGAIFADRFFVLKRGGDTPRVEWLSAGDAITSLIRFSYNIRFSTAPIHMQKRERQFKQCAALHNQAQIGILHIPADITRLDETVEVALAAQDSP